MLSILRLSRALIAVLLSSVWEGLIHLPNVTSQTLYYNVHYNLN